MLTLAGPTERDTFRIRDYTRAQLARAPRHNYYSHNEFCKNQRHKKSVKLPINDNLLKFSSVKRYFPEAIGLIFHDNNEEYGVEIIDDDVQINDN